MARRIALVLKGYPRLSETFIAQEILALEGLGLDGWIVSQIGRASCRERG